MHDFAGFVKHLHFFFCISVFCKYVNLRNQIESQLVCKLLNSDRFIGQNLAILFIKFVHSGCAGTTGCLISRYMYGFYMRKLFDGFQCDNHLDGCAIRVSDHAARTIFSIGCIHFGHHQRYICIHTESAGIIDHYRTILGNGFLEFLRCACTGRSESNVHPFKVIVVLQKFDLDLFTAESIFGPGTTFRAEQN